MHDWIIELIAEEKTVSARTSGTMDMPAIEAFSTEVLAKGIEAGFTKYLIDHRQMTPAVSTIGIYGLPEFYQRLGLPRNVSVAILYSLGTQAVADFEFFEAVATNNGYSMRLFTAHEAAMAWLKPR
jgi:hypothetical protein